MANALALTLHASGEVSASGSGDAAEIGALRTMAIIRLRVIATTADFVLRLESSPDGETGWREAKAWTGRSGLRVASHIDQLEPFVRVRWELESGTATFEVKGEAHALYATRADILDVQLPAKALEDVEQETIARHLLGGTSDVDDALNTIYPLPLTAWPHSLTERAGAIAALRILQGARGFDPEGKDVLILKRHDDAVKWLQLVAQRKIVPAGLTPRPVDAIRTSSGNPAAPEPIPPRFSDNWGDFG